MTREIYDNGESIRFGTNDIVFGSKEITGKLEKIQIYCDRCDSLISTKYPDDIKEIESGWQKYLVKEHTVFEITVGEEKLIFSKVLCDKCKMKAESALKHTLFDFGFESTKEFIKVKYE